MLNFMSSPAGRWTRIVVGLVLLIGGFCWGPWGFIASVLGVMFIALGASDTCLLAGWFGQYMGWYAPGEPAGFLGAVVGAVGAGLMILICAMQGDTEADADKLAAKICKLRIFKDDAGKMNLSVKDSGGGALIVSQFTLAADLRGNRPGFSYAAAPDEGKRLYEYFSSRIAAEGVAVANGIFGADMDVSLNNDGPVTIWMDTATL